MKKIFTLIFSMGLLTAAFAQDGHRHDSKQNNGIVDPSYGYQSDHGRGTNKYFGTTPFMNSNTWDSQLNRGYDSKDGRDFQINDDRRDWFFRDRHDDFRYKRHMRNKYSRRHYMTSTGFQLSFGFGR